MVSGLPKELIALITDFVEDTDYHALLSVGDKNMTFKLDGLQLFVTENRNFDDDAVMALPKGLKILAVNTVCRVTDESALYLPENLEVLDIGAHVTNAFASNLPKSLLRLSLHGYSRIMLGFIPFLPKTLVSLDLHSDEPIINDRHVPFLPRGLTELSLGVCSLLSSSSISDLPRELISLNLGAMVWLDEEHMKFLPRGLKKFKSANGLGAVGIGHLPETLESLKLNHIYLGDGDCYLFPRTLKVLALGYEDELTEACLPHLPRGLEVLLLPENENFHNPELLNHFKNMRKFRSKYLRI